MKQKLNPGRLFHVSEEEAITHFLPRPSPFFLARLNGPVVFAITERLLHHYLLPRACPRVCFYAGPQTTEIDKKRFLGNEQTKYVVAVEEEWWSAIKATTLYIYQLPTSMFEVIDATAGYWISYSPVRPVNVSVLHDLPNEFGKREDVELRRLPSLQTLATSVVQSSLQFSLIRMRNASP